MSVTNIFKNIPARLSDELFEVILEGTDFKVERIVSQGHSSPENFWYDQDHYEWVMVLQGRAKLSFQGKSEPIVLGPGDYLNIPAHTRHRVDWTDAERETVWLAIHYG